MKSNEHIKKFQPGEIPKCAKNQIWEAGDKNWSLGPASTGSIQKPGQPTIILSSPLTSKLYLLSSSFQQNFVAAIVARKPFTQQF